MLKEKPKAAPLPLKHMAIQEARQQTSQSRQEENSYAVDVVENSTILVAGKGGQALKKVKREFTVKSIQRKEQARRNVSLQETYFKEADPQNSNEKQKNVSLQETHYREAYKEQGKELARRKAIKQTKAKTERKVKFSERLKKALERSVKESGESLLLAAGALLIAIIPLIIVLSIAGSLFTVDVEKAPVSDEVKAYAGLIQVYAIEHGIPEFTELIMAVMMQESGGRGSDPMQASECAFNTEYPNYPNGITDPEYSVDVGIQNLASVLHMAGVTNIDDTESLYIALQAYNFGPGYISYAYSNGGHSQLVSIAFSEMMAERMGWESYGDPYYVQHVLRYIVGNN